MPISENREYRKAELFNVQKRVEGDEPSFFVEGYATTFDRPYLLWEDGDSKFYEKVDARAFDNADLSDVIMQYDHSGMVFARNRNGSLDLSIDEHGLKVVANLGLTEAARGLYESIRTGLVTEMSFAFSVAEDSFDRETRTRTILKIKKLFDVSAVSIPANPETTIAATRSYIDGVIEREKQELLKAEEAKKRILRIKILTEV